MRARTLAAAALLGAAGAVLPAAPASACIAIYVPVIGSVCNTCPTVEHYTGAACP